MKNSTKRRSIWYCAYHDKPMDKQDARKHFQWCKGIIYKETKLD